MIVNKCARCGHDISIDKPKEIVDIKCSHCNKEFTIDKKTKYTAMTIVVISVFGFSFLITLISELLSISPYILLLPLIVLSFFMYNWSLYLLAKFNRVAYIAVSNDKKK